MKTISMLLFAVFYALSSVVFAASSPGRVANRRIFASTDEGPLGLDVAELVATNRADVFMFRQALKNDVLVKEEVPDHFVGSGRLSSEPGYDFKSKVEIVADAEGITVTTTSKYGSASYKSVPIYLDSQNCAQALNERLCAGDWAVWEMSAWGTATADYIGHLVFDRKGDLLGYLSDKGPLGTAPLGTVYQFRGKSDANDRLECHSGICVGDQVETEYVSSLPPFFRALRMKGTVLGWAPNGILLNDEARVEAVEFVVSKLSPIKRDKKLPKPCQDYSINELESEWNLMSSPVIRQCKASGLADECISLRGNKKEQTGGYAQPTDNGATCTVSIDVEGVVFSPTQVRVRK